jgi:shikimate dehydrogenase
MRKYGLIGFPLGHSFSSKYFSEKFNREEITECSYENFPLMSIEELPRLVESMPELYGLNVTIPYKASVLQYLNSFDQPVSEIGAANVLKIRRTDRKILISGYNSDITGINDSLIPFINANLKNALILGTGGSSRAVLYTLRKLGLNVILVSRRKDSGLISYNDVNKALLDKIDLIINTTPLGMFPDVNSKPDIDYNLLNGNHILFDLVYNPEITAFLQKGKERGCKIIPGIKMLHSQAERSWEIWNDPEL